MEANKTVEAPAVEMISTTVNQSVWLVRLPSSPAREGATYRVTTYPKSDLLFLETAAGRAISQNVAHRLVPIIRAALSRATGA